MQQKLGQFDTHLPPSAELGNQPLKIVMTETQSQQHLLGLLLTAAATKHGNLFGDLVVSVQQPGVVGAFIVSAVGNLVGEALLQGGQLVDMAESRHSFIDDCTGGIRNHLLWQVSHSLPRGYHQRTRLGLLPAAEDFQKRGLSGAVFPHQTDTVVVGNVESDILE